MKCPVCGKRYRQCPECKGTGKGGQIQGEYGECPMCSGDGDLHDCTPKKD